MADGEWGEWQIWGTLHSMSAATSPQATTDRAALTHFCTFLHHAKRLKGCTKTEQKWKPHTSRFLKKIYTTGAYGEGKHSFGITNNQVPQFQVYYQLFFSLPSVLYVKKNLHFPP